MISEICGCPIGVGADRLRAAQLILERFPETNLLLSDDGLQHYALGRDIEIAVCRELSLGNGLMLPAGPLREPPGRLRQVDITIDRDSDQVTESLGEVWNLANPQQGPTGARAGGHRLSGDFLRQPAADGYRRDRARVPGPSRVQRPGP
jgi:tetraacyldisaccharide-1-P 4'-kinase